MEKEGIQGTEQLRTAATTRNPHLYFAMDLSPIPSEEIRRFLDVPVKGVMQREVLTLTPDETLETAAKTMLEHGIRHLPVVDDNNVLVGILSERDLRAKIGSGLENWPRAATQLDDLVTNDMTPDPLVLGIDASLHQALDIFEDERVGAIPIVDDGDRLVGLLSYVDVLDWIQRQLRPSPPRVTPTVPPSEQDEHTRELTGRDAPVASASFGSVEPAPRQASDITPPPDDIEDEPGSQDVLPDHIEEMGPER